MTKLYKIVCKTHLHAGSGDSNFGVIDRLVQRDPTDQLPCIYASSLKGAFREYWDECQSKNEANLIFGKDDKGSLIFHQAHLLSIPMRSNKRPYFNVTAPMALENLAYKLEIVGSIPRWLDDLIKIEVPENKIYVFQGYTSGLKIEDYEGANVENETPNLSQAASKVFGDYYCLVNDADFIRICSDYSLPVIARNNLENGQSNNLWYEQIIPREARFFFATTETPGLNSGKKEAVEKFYKTFYDSNTVLQIGANATIGYGQCVTSKIGLQ